MIITHKLTLSLDCRGQMQSIDGVQGDTVRAVEIALQQQETAWTVPEGTTAVIRYRRIKGGTGGSYDTLPDGTAAYTISEDKVTVYLAPQIFALAGAVELQVTLMKDGAELTCFSIMVYVQGNLSEAAEDTESYVNLSAHIQDETKKAVQDALAEGLPNSLTINGQSYDGSTPVDMEVAKKRHSVIYIVGNEGDSAGVWTGNCEDITEYFDGLTIAFKASVAGGGGGTTLNINGLGAVDVKRNGTSLVTYYYTRNSVLLLTYTTTNGVGYWQMADTWFEDTKNTVGAGNYKNTHLYLIGTPAQQVPIVSYSNSLCYIGKDNCLYSGGAKVMVEADVAALIEAAMEGIATAEGVSF